MIEQKQLENVEFFKYLGRILADGRKYICELNPGLLW
jgi:hypothetical protein